MTDETTVLIACPSADLDTQLVQLKPLQMENRTITKTPYEEKNSHVIVLYFMSRSAPDAIV